MVFTCFVFAGDPLPGKKNEAVSPAPEQFQTLADLKMIFCLKPGSLLSMESLEECRVY